MANHKSAEKRARQNIKRRDRNVSLRSQAKTMAKKALESIEKAGSLEEAVKALQEGGRALQKAVSRGVLPKERASRKISRLAALMNKKFSKKSSTSSKRA